MINRLQKLAGSNSCGPDIIGFRVTQFTLIGNQRSFSSGQSAVGLCLISPVGCATLNPLGNGAQQNFMILYIFSGQFQQPSFPHNIIMGPDRVKRDTLNIIMQPIFSGT